MFADIAGRLEATAARAIVGAAELGPLRGLIDRTTRTEPKIDSGLRVLLALRGLLGAKPTSEMGVERARHRMHKEAVLHAGRLAKVGETRDLAISLPSGSQRARLYTPVDAPASGPLIVYFHGGGYVFGDIEMFDAPCRLLCAESGVRLLSVEYALAPEHPFPAPLNDGYAAFRWAVDHAAQLGADAARIGVGGDSAGANMSAVLCQRAVAEGGPVPALQLLIYPGVDRITSYASLQRYATGFLLQRDEIEWYHNTYTAAGGVDRADPRISPLFGTLTNLPAAIVVTAGLDPLCDEGAAYAAALEHHGTRCEHLRFDGLIHGFLNMIGPSRSSRDAVAHVARRAGALLA